MKTPDLAGARAYRCALIAATLLGLGAALAPVTGGSATGPIWLATQQATDLPQASLHPGMATYRNHAFLVNNWGPWVSAVTAVS